MNENVANAESLKADAAAIAAIKGGDKDRYQELVERYGGKVFAVAWARLGDRDLAEEATQEAFIKAFQHLPLLGNANKFGSWIAAIARNIAINLGLRHRRELNKRERWALDGESVVSPAAPAEESSTPSPDQSLRGALAELPAIHRECLVLFYIEGKSIAEASGLLGLSEAAFKTRLHRARGALRSLLEEKLEESLEQLRPSGDFVRRVMLLLPAQSLGTGALNAVSGLSAGLFGALGKLLPAPLMILLLPFFGALPGLFMARWTSQLEIRNFRDQEGFRARLFRERQEIALPVTIALVTAAMLAGPLFTSKSGFLIHCIFFLWLLYCGGRAIYIAPTQMNIACLLGTATMTISIIGCSTFDLAKWWWPLCFGLFCFATGFSFSQGSQTRFDYSLVLRRWMGIMPRADRPAARETSTRPLTRKEAVAFGRFLGKRGLVQDFRHGWNRVSFRLAPARPTIWMVFAPFYWRGFSMLDLCFDGMIRVKIGATDEKTLRDSAPEATWDRSQLEDQVTVAVEHALAAFRAGNNEEAEKWLGQEPEEEIYFQAPAKSRATWWRTRFFYATGLFMFITIGVGFIRGDFKYPIHGHRLKPLAVTEAELHHAMNHRAMNAYRDSTLRIDYQWSHAFALAYPPKSLFSPEAWEAVTGFLWNSLDWHPDAASGHGMSFLQAALSYSEFQKAVVSGLITTDDLTTRGLTTDALRAMLMTLRKEDWNRLVRLERIMIMEKTEGLERYGVIDLSRFARHWQFLKAVGCLDLIDKDPAVNQLRLLQILPENPAATENPHVDRKALHGLFLTFGNDPILCTYNALTVLDLAGALDRIDREACIKGILRFHHGRGIFGSFKKDGLFMWGDAQDTYCAFESLRLLNALDRVPDLDQWEFRPKGHSLPPTKAGDERFITSDEIEAWVLRERFRAAITVPLEQAR